MSKDDARRHSADGLAADLVKATPDLARRLTGKDHITSEDAHRQAARIARETDRKADDK